VPEFAFHLDLAKGTLELIFGSTWVYCQGESTRFKERWSSNNWCLLFPNLHPHIFLAFFSSHLFNCSSVFCLLRVCHPLELTATGVSLELALLEYTRKRRRGLEKLGIGGIQSGSTTDVWSPRSHARQRLPHIAGHQPTNPSASTLCCQIGPTRQISQGSENDRTKRSPRTRRWTPRQRRGDQPASLTR
jgi:hypothetical protein